MEKIESLQNLMAGQSLHIDDLKKQLAEIDRRKIDAQNSHQLHNADIAILRRTRGDLLTEGSSIKDVDKQLSNLYADNAEIVDLIDGLCRKAEALTAEINEASLARKTAERDLYNLTVDAEYAEYERLLKLLIVSCTRLVKYTFKSGMGGRQVLYGMLPDELWVYHGESKSPKVAFCKNGIQP